ncbi:MAG: sigma-54 dependent transcriptional regulator [Desulfobulbaceae bacterium]
MTENLKNTAPPPHRLLVIDDEENMRHMLRSLLEESGYRVDTADNGAEALELVRHNRYDSILCDIRMPKMDGMGFLQAARPWLEHSTVIMMSAYGTIDTALEAIKQGAYDFISKPFKTDEVLLTLKKAEERESLRRENKLLREEIRAVQGEGDFGAMVGRTRVMRDLFELGRKVAPYNTTVLVLGESGTGKELVARGLHTHSPRAAMPFIAVNCGTIPENLLESEFFGYVKGAFTGADQDRKGLFGEAEGGTLFLDEIGELPPPLQVKLLRVLQEGEIRPVGGSSTEPVNVRVIAATARDLAEEVAAGTFRQDLFYRLNVLSIRIPPLRDRIEDVPLLADHFRKRLNRKLDTAVEKIAPEAMSLLVNYPWPGNVRELENVLERAMILCGRDTITPDDLPEKIRAGAGFTPKSELYGGFSLKEGSEQLERLLISRALRETGGNKSRAAELLEISYPSLLAKIKKYGLENEGRAS